MRFAFLVLFAIFAGVSAQNSVPVSFNACFPGYYGSTCLPCPANTYSNTFGATSCTPCPAFQTSGPASDYCTASTGSFIAYANQGVAGGYLIPTNSSKALCPDTDPTHDQCVVDDLYAAESVCGADVNCGGVICQLNNKGCSLRYFPLTPLFSGNYNFYLKNAGAGHWYLPKRNQVLFQTATPPAGNSFLLCKQYNSTVAGQCTPPTLASAQTLCSFDDNCLGVNCHADDTVCTLRYGPLIQGPVASTAYNAYLKV